MCYTNYTSFVSANTHFHAGRWQDAITVYSNVKTLAIRTRKAAAKQYKESYEGTSRRSPVVYEMANLAAIAANNMSVTYMKLGMGTEAVTASYEALKLDPRYAYR